MAAVDESAAADAPAADAASPELSAATLQLQPYLGKFMRLTMSDGRIVTGRFVGTDRELNLVMSEGEETQQLRVGGGDQEFTRPIYRKVGLVIAPGNHVTKIEMEQFSDTENSEQSEQPSDETRSAAAAATAAEPVDAKSA
ncbi:hypothetical protein CAOG_00885 [Capsaspora owczarzaki ATCC 30864]|uniref:Sm domain-containing protein n=1 Tax=Capsaspora owczarzaki (strain ATCC 30864) TaxID=595528 RepID=A0A0D2U2I1_CAPO3|nr:hypothetical protein CAOG_00885 [Capsaspora owczarzaki ATCC 30864]KJE89411.1 hypothetical protein CAOG_000885 [Capsaspora owczarzaki ATCC 30864]|eukprot:XP_004365756.1 hypothetical protein CAOG_00885 [Capsaspora owczarzaki ATCC 30864]